MYIYIYMYIHIDVYIIYGHCHKNQLYNIVIYYCIYIYIVNDKWTLCLLQPWPRNSQPQGKPPSHMHSILLKFQDGCFSSMGHLWLCYVLSRWQIRWPPKWKEAKSGFQCFQFNTEGKLKCCSSMFIHVLVLLVCFWLMLFFSGMSTYKPH